MKTAKVLLGSIALGAALAILASALSGYSWYTSKHWNTTALQATFNHLETGPGNHIDFCYQLQNNTASDYYVDVNSQPTLMAMLSKRHPLSFGYQVLLLQHPIRVQAGQRTVAKISFGNTDALQNARFASAPAGGDQLANLIREQYGNLDGFVLYDLQKRYRIVFPKGW
jgi:hypothetical protein